MSKTGRPNHRRKSREGNRQYEPERRIVVEGVQREHPDLRKLSRAMIAMGIEAEAATATRTEDASTDNTPAPDEAARQEVTNGDK
ncbi:hypothetical protein ACWDUL_08710 [Nocardia niigatensis]